MRIIAVKTLKAFWESHPVAKQALLQWYREAGAAEWDSPNELKQQFGNASVLSKKRVVFNIRGNAYRLLVDIEYRFKILFVVWIGSHKEYNEINAKEISYVTGNKK